MPILLKKIYCITECESLLILTSTMIHINWWIIIHKNNQSILWLLCFIEEKDINLSLVCCLIIHRRSVEVNLLGRMFKNRLFYWHLSKIWLKRLFLFRLKHVYQICFCLNDSTNSSNKSFKKFTFLTWK